MSFSLFRSIHDLHQLKKACSRQRSYKRQGIDKIPSVHLGPAASQMEKRGIRTDKGEVNRQIAADNKLLKEIKARITRLYRWSKAETEKPQTQQSSLTALWEAQQQLNAPRTRTGKIRALQESAALFSFLQANGIQSMQQLHEKIADMNSRYYDLRGKIVKAERRITTLAQGELMPASTRTGYYLTQNSQDLRLRRPFPGPRTSSQEGGNLFETDTTQWALRQAWHL